MLCAILRSTFRDDGVLDSSPILQQSEVQKNVVKVWRCGWTHGSVCCRRLALTRQLLAIAIEIPSNMLADGPPNEAATS